MPDIAPCPDLDDMMDTLVGAARRCFDRGFKDK